MQKLIAKTWSDEEFKKRLLADPKAVFKEEGFEVPAGLEIRVYENSEKVFHFVLPPRPEVREMRDEEMAAASGGSCYPRCGCDGGICCFA